MSVDISLLFKTAEKMGIVLTKRQECQFEKYYVLLVDWNEKINLTAITEWDEVVIKHFIDSMSIVNVYGSLQATIDALSGKTLVDVGTGAGFPGIVLKILIPELRITLMDSLDKRIKFLKLVIEELGLEGIEAVHGRVEDLARMDIYRENFDFATARAVASLPVLCEYCLPFVKTDGFFLAYKSERAEEELNMSERAVKELCGKVHKTFTFLLPTTDLNRTIIEIVKTGNVSKKYPRKAGTPSKKPL